MDKETFSNYSNNNEITGMRNFNSIQFIASKLEDFLNLLRSHADSESLSKYFEFLNDLSDQENISRNESLAILKIVKECLKLALSYKADNKFTSEKEKNLYLELCTILQFVNLNCLNGDDIEHSNVALNIICICTKLVYHLNSDGCYIKAEYYAKKCKKLTQLLINTFSNNKNLFLSKILIDKQISFDLFYVEAISNINKLDETFHEMQQLKEKISDFWNYQEYFIRLCYNVSLKLYKKEQYEHAILLLESALHIERKEKQCDPDKVAVLKLLIHLYMKQDPEDKSQKCFKLLDTIKENVTSFNFLILLKVALFSNNQNAIKDTLNSFFQIDNLSVPDITNVIRQLKENKYDKLALEFLWKLKERKFEPEEKLNLINLELRICFKIDNLERASNLIEEATKLVKFHKMTQGPANNIFKAVITFADCLFKRKCFMQCVTWCKKLLKFIEMTKMQDLGLNYLLQKICLCYLEINEIQLAKETFARIEWPSSGTDSVQVYLALRLAIMCEDENLVDVALQNIGNDNPSVDKVLQASCQKAFAAGKTTFISKILEQMLLKCSTIEGRKFSCLTLAQSLVKVNLAIAETEEAREKILVYMEKALEIIDFPDHGDTSQVMTEWFSRVAWNMALRPAIKVRHVFEFFDMCCRFLEKMNGSPTRLKNTLIFTVAAGIQTLREESEGDDEERHNTAKRILAAIGKCRDLEKDNYDIISLLYIYEFETRIIMEDSLMEEILKKMLQAPFVDEKALQTVASIAYEQSSKHYRLITLALEGSINRIAEKSFGDYGQLIQLQHSILQVLFYVQEYITSSVEEETLHKCKNIYKMIKEDDDFQEYPKTKILWLMTKCWNWGVNMLAAGNTAMSYEWCTMAMKFLDELKDLKYLHEEKLQALYSSYFGSQTV